MRYQTYLPHPALAGFVKCYWTLEDPDIHASRERIFPDGCMELIFHFGDLFRKYGPDGKAVTQPRSFIHGQLDEFIEIQPTGRTGIFSIRFYPDGVRPFVDFPLSEITGEYVTTRDIWGKQGDELAGRIIEARDHQHRRQLVDNFLLQRLARTGKRDALVTGCLQAMISQRGNISISALAKDLGVSRRNLERRFTGQVGVSPKMLARITRFQHALKLIRENQGEALTMAAYEAGFYDQAHFIKDFKAFTGFNPRSYLFNDPELVRFFTY